MTTEEMIQQIEYLEWVVRIKNQAIARLKDQVIQAEDQISSLQDELAVTRDDLDVFAARVDELTMPLGMDTEEPDIPEKSEWVHEFTEAEKHEQPEPRYFAGMPGKW